MERQGLYFRSPWSRHLQVTSIFCLVVIFGLIGYVIVEREEIAMKGTLVVCGVLLGVIVLAMLWSLAIMPKGISVTEEGITIHLLATDILIPKSEITDIKKLSAKASRRWIAFFGVKGLFSYSGSYYNKQLGQFVARVTDWNRAYIIFREDKKPIVVSADGDLTRVLGR